VILRCEPAGLYTMTRSKILVQAIAREIGAEELSKFHTYYQGIVNPRTRTLTTVELKRHLLSIPRLPITQEELSHMIIQVDLDGDGIVSSNEFIIIMYQSNLDTFLWASSREKYNPLREAKTCRDKLKVTLTDGKSSCGAALLTFVIFLFIGLSLLALCFQTLLVVRDMPELQLFLEVVHYASTAVFTVELALRLAVAPSVRAVFTDALLYFDFLSIFPVYVEVALVALVDDPEAVEQSPFLDMLRVFRLSRLLKLSRYIPFMRTVGVTFRKSAVPFAMTFCIVVIYALIAAALLFFFERGTWNEQYATWVRESGERGPTQSMVDWIFFVIYTMLTVGCVFSPTTPSSPPMPSSSCVVVFLTHALVDSSNSSAAQ
jgi:hypothetical protein